MAFIPVLAAPVTLRDGDFANKQKSRRDLRYLRFLTYRSRLIDCLRKTLLMA